MRPAIIVACGHGGVIGKNGKLPWRLSADLVYFKRLTLGKPIVMGRETWESLPLKPLPGRRNIVMSRNQGFDAEGAEVTASIKDLEAMLGDDEECMVIGGAQVYQQFLPLVETIYLTRVDARIDGDVYFPPLNDGEWLSVRQGGHLADDKNDYAMDFFIMRRKRRNQR